MCFYPLHLRTMCVGVYLPFIGGSYLNMNRGGVFLNKRDKGGLFFNMIGGLYLLMCRGGLLDVKVEYTLIGP